MQEATGDVKRIATAASYGPPSPRLRRGLAKARVRLAGGGGLTIVSDAARRRRWRNQDVHGPVRARRVRGPLRSDIRSYRTLDFPDLGALAKQFLRDAGSSAADIESASFGVAGPVNGTRAQLTNIPWIVDVDAMRGHLPIQRAHLLNDLEALAWSVPVLNDAGDRRVAGRRTPIRRATPR